MLEGYDDTTIADAYVRRYNSLDSFIQACQDRRYRNGASSETNRGGWHGSNSFEHATQLAMEGWTEKRGLVDDLSAGLIHAIRENMKPAVEYIDGFSGSSVMMGRYMQGNPRCVMRPIITEEVGTQRTTRILINAIASASVDPDVIMRRGIAVVALVELLAAANRSSEIFMESPISGRSLHGNSKKRKYTILVQIKHSSDVLDINKLMFAMAHPSFLRRFIFAYEEGEESKIRRGFGIQPEGYGYGMPIPSVMKNEVNADIVLEKVNYGETWNVKDSVDWIIRQLEAVGVTIEKREV